MNTSHAPVARSLLALAAALALLTACGGDGDNKAPSQVAARVNGKEITVHQLNLMLQGVREPDNATRQKALDALIDQEILVQKAEELKLDRDPNVVQMIEQQRRELLARTALERLGIKPAEVTTQSVGEFYAANPLLFAERKVYVLDNFVIDASAFNDELKAELDKARTADDVRAALDSRSIKYTAQEVRRPAEQFGPLLANVAKLAAGDILILPEKEKMVLAQLREALPAPVDQEKAEPVIKRLLASKNRNEAVKSNIQALHKTAQIEYVQKFDTPAATKEAAPAGERDAGSSDALKEGLKGLK